MTGSGLMVLLPLISAIAGGIVGAWANSWYREREKKKAEDEERNNLLFLIDTEVGFNAWRLEAASDGPPSNVIPYLRTDVWDTSQARLAQLLPISDMRILAPYCEQIRMLKAFDIAAKDDPRQISDIEWQLIDETRVRGFAIFANGPRICTGPRIHKPSRNHR